MFDPDTGGRKSMPCLSVDEGYYYTESTPTPTKRELSDSLTIDDISRATAIPGYSRTRQNISALKRRTVKQTKISLGKAKSSKNL